MIYNSKYVKFNSKKTFPLKSKYSINRMIAFDFEWEVTTAKNILLF